jgi:pilus assembly protein FimV
VEQNNDYQYDDDLTIGSEEYDDSYYTGAEDLFEITADEESPISRLKSLVLSIDWEITDEVLLLFNDELVELREYWAEDPIHLVYVQALEKISKYIYIKKADSHPSAIKLLLTLYQNLEKIVSSEEWTEEKKKEILFEDVKRFDLLKAHIKREAMGESAPVVPDVGVGGALPVGGVRELINLKAIVLGIDWEITDEDLNNLRLEVLDLEKKFVESKPRLILLQGIGTLGAYIKHKKSNAHAEAFKVLHLFYESLEKIVSSTLSLAEEKAILFPAVEKFNDFKALLGSTISPEAISREKEERDEEEDEQPSGVIVPAFADIPEDEIHGFQADDEAQALGYEDPEDVVSHVAGFFSEDGVSDDVELEGAVEEKTTPPVKTPAEKIESSEEAEPAPALTDFTDVLGTAEIEQAPSDLPEVESGFALQGVDVETEADDVSEEENLPELDGQLAPALSIAGDDEQGGFVEARAAAELDGEIEGAISNFFDEEDEVPAPPGVEELAAPVAPALFEVEEPGLDEVLTVDKERALQGVEVETEADDVSGEAPLPFSGAEIAPALAAEEPELSEEAFAQGLEEAGAATGDIAATVDQFFGEDAPESQESEVVFELVDDGVDALVGLQAMIKEAVAGTSETVPQHVFMEIKTLKGLCKESSTEKELLEIIATLVSHINNK